VTRRPARPVFPFGGSSLACRRAARVAPICAPSREGPVLLGVLYANESRGRWAFPAPASTSGFRPGPAVSSSAVRPIFRRGFILPRAFRLLQSATACALPFVPDLNLTRRFDSNGRRAPPLGSSPSSRPQQAASTTPRGIPTPRSRSVLDVSHVLDGLLRHLPLRACFIPLPRPGFALQGFVPRTEPYRVSPAVSCPPVVGRARL